MGARAACRRRCRARRGRHPDGAPGATGAHRPQERQGRGHGGRPSLRGGHPRGTIRDRFPEDAVLAEESGHSGAKHGTGPSDGSGAAEVGRPRTPDLDRRPAGRDRELRQRAAVLLRLGGAGRRWQPDGGRRARPCPRRAVQRGAGRRRLAQRRAGRARGQGAPHRHRVPRGASVDRWARREAKLRKAIRVGRVFGSAALAMAYLADSRFDSLHPGRAACRSGTSPRRGSSRRRPASTVTDTRGRALVRAVGAGRPPVGIVAATPGHHRGAPRCCRDTADHDPDHPAPPRDALRARAGALGRVLPGGVRVRRDRARGRHGVAAAHPRLRPTSTTWRCSRSAPRRPGRRAAPRACITSRGRCRPSRTWSTPPSSCRRCVP